MTRNSSYESWNPKGFTFILSPPWVDTKTNLKTQKTLNTKTWRSSCLATFNETEKTWPILYENFTQKYITYNGMFYYGLSNLKIINIWKSDVPELNVGGIIKIKSKFASDEPRFLDILHIHYNDFFFSGITSHLSNELKNNEDIIFFVESDNWGDVVKGFTYCLLNIDGGSTNQRHIFNHLHHKMSMYLMILYGRKLANELSFYDWKNPLVNYRSNYNFSNEKPSRYNNSLIKSFWRIFQIGKINDFITITKIIIESNQLATLHNNFIVIDYLRFWVSIINYQLWNELYIHIVLWLLEDNDVTTVIKYIRSADKFNTLKINSDILLRYTNIKDYKLSQIYHGNTLKEEILNLKKIDEIMKTNINYEAIKLIENSYLTFISSKTKNGSHFNSLQTEDSLKKLEDNLNKLDGDVTLTLEIEKKDEKWAYNK
jgi:hypothetical protein